jgi:hypothetical protein
VDERGSSPGSAKRLLGCFEIQYAKQTLGVPRVCRQSPFVIIVKLV